MKKLLGLFPLGLLFFLVSTLLPHVVNAYDINSLGVANYLNVTNAHVEDGDIVIATTKGYFLSSVAYDPRVFGVVTDKPAIVLKNNNQKNGYPIMSTGVVNVKVNGQNGNIKKGDFIATSSLPGAGMKAAQNSYVIGEAVENATFTNPKDVSKISVNMNLHYFQVSPPQTYSIFDIFNLSKLATSEQPSRVIQYTMAAIIAIMSFVFGFIIFARTINTGLEALGRNPLAGRMIQLSIIFNVILVMIIIMTGIFLVYLVLHL